MGYSACKHDLVVDQRLTFNKIIENILSMEINCFSPKNKHKFQTFIANECNDNIYDL